MCKGNITRLIITTQLKDNMKKLYNFSLWFFLLGIISVACREDYIAIEQPKAEVVPQADFTYAVQEEDPFTFEFSNESTNFKDLQWTFGDDSVSTDVSPVHTFPFPGTFLVGLTTISEDGVLAKKEVEVEIVTDGLIDFSAARTEEENTVRFNNSSQAPIESVVWEFGDGSEPSSEESPTKSYEPGELYEATLTITTPKGSVATLTKLVTSNGTVIDVTNTYLKNPGPGFITAARDGRWGVLADWYVNDAVKNKNNDMGSWDEFGDNVGNPALSMEKWGGGEPDIINGKISQTVTLPAGEYYFISDFLEFQIFDDLYIVAAQGPELPDVDAIETTSLGYLLLEGSQFEFITHSFPFKVEEETQVTIGFLCTLEEAEQFFKVKRVQLFMAD